MLSVAGRSSNQLGADLSKHASGDTLSPLIEVMMQPPVYAYYLTPAGAADDDQLALIESFCMERGLLLGETFCDDPGAARTPWLERPGGAALAARLKAGDQVVVARASGIYATLAAFQTVVEHFREQGVELHVVGGLGQDLFSGEMWDHLPEALRIVRAIRQALRSGVVREAMAERRAQGKRHCSSAGYGWRWTRGGRRVPDRQEQEVIRKIIEWKQQGYSWAQIAGHLLRQGVTAPNGREWSAARVRRAFFAWMLAPTAAPTTAAPIEPAGQPEQTATRESAPSP
jgi:DNA invertase Pin-like site-specific DNA recombinase